MAWTGSPINVKREVLIGFDLLLAVVVGLVLYAASARDPQAPPDVFDGLQLAARGQRARGRRGGALRRSPPASPSLASRPTEWRLLARTSFCSSTWRGRRGSYARFLRRRSSFAALERWQIAYLPVFSVWAAVVVVVFPPLFGYR